MTIHQMVLDARTGQPFPFGADVLACISAAALFHGRQDAAQGRRVLSVEGFRQFRRRQDAMSLKQLAQRDQRFDALTSSVGAFPRDLEYIYEEVLTEPRRPLNMDRLIAVDRRVPLGARTHTARRRLSAGDTMIYKGGSEIPVVSGSRVEETFGIIHLVTSVVVDYFDLIANNFAGRNDFADDSREAVRLLLERANTLGFSGDVLSKIWGILNYPHLAKTVSAYTFSPANIAADPAGARAELNRLANYAMEASGGTFKPNRLATSIRLRNALMQTQNSTASDKSVGQYWLDGQEDINTIEGVHELRGVGPSGEDGLFFYDDQLNSTANVIVQPPTPLPMFAVNALQNQVVYVMTIGGVVMRNVGNNLLAFGAYS